MSVTNPQGTALGPGKIGPKGWVPQGSNSSAGAGPESGGKGMHQYSGLRAIPWSPEFPAHSEFGSNPLLLQQEVLRT